MVSGDITNEYDERRGGTNGLKPVCGLTLEIVVANGTSEKEEVLDEIDHSCMNCLLTDAYFKTPALLTAGKTVRLELLTEDDAEIFTTGDLDATNAENHSRHTQRGLMKKTAMKIVCDANVGSAKTFFVEVRGL
jgi:hypothetical protein